MKLPDLEPLVFVRARDTDDSVKVCRTVTGEPVYSLNGGPYLPVPSKYGKDSVKLMAYRALYDHQRQCSPCDAEELTLP